MSYNTRRTGGGNAPSGRNAPTTQVNYHQQPSRPGGTAGQTRTPGYTSTQQSAGYNSSSQPAYTTQTAYSTTTPPLPKPAQNQPQPPPAAAQPPPPPTPQPKQTPSTPAALKQEPLTPADTPKMDTSENGDTTLSGTPSKLNWKKKTFAKLPNKVRKARQNARLRRILNPKNALTFLYELKPGLVKFVVREEPGWGYVASVDIDGKTYSGHALTISKAKVQASEQALRHLLLEQLSKSQTAPPSPDKEGAEKEEDKEAKDEAMEEEKGEDGESKPKRSKEQPEDDLPWGSLAAFALHKLFAEWQKEGAEAAHPPPEKFEEEVPEEAYFTRRPGPPPEFGFPRRFAPGPYSRGRGFSPYPPRGPPPPGFGGMHRRPPAAGGFPITKTPAAVVPSLSVLPMKKIPEDANKRHPVMLLNQLKPNVIYNESQEGQAPNVVFNIAVEIEGKQYVGLGKSKKEAKKAAAKAALAPLGIHYEEDK